MPRNTQEAQTDTITKCHLCIIAAAIWHTLHSLASPSACSCWETNDLRDSPPLHPSLSQRLAPVAQERLGLPWVVGLDLTAADTDMFNLAPAVVVKRLDPPEDASDPADPQNVPQSYYVCLLADNR